MNVDILIKPLINGGFANLVDMIFVASVLKNLEPVPLQTQNQKESHRAQ